MGLPSSNIRELSDSVINENIPLETALKVLTSNPATILKLPGKGFILQGMDADLLFLDSRMKMIHLIAMGNWVIRNYEVLKKGSYEY